jgi:hypothetical protein
LGRRDNIESVLRFVLASALLLTSACGSEEEDTEPACVAVPTDCDEQISPNYQALYGEVFRGSCAQSEGSCHGADDRQAGLDFSDEERSYALLLGTEGGRPRVVPGDAGCSKLVVRTHSVGKPWQMPPGTPLREPELCSIRKWIAAGAPRTSP